MIVKDDILKINELIRGELALKEPVSENSSYSWDSYNGVKCCNPLKARCTDHLLTLSMGSADDLDGYYVGLEESSVTLSGDLPEGGLPKLIFSPNFSGCHLALFSRKENGLTFYIGAHIYKDTKKDIPKAIIENPHSGLTLVDQWSSAGISGANKQVFGLIWVEPKDITAYWVIISGVGSKGGARVSEVIEANSV